jgi:multiple sugar transport system ATP-binding protein
MTLLIRDLTKSYGSVQALQGCCLNVGDGELVTLVGPSGCGKSTLLKVVAGFLSANSGEVEISGRHVNELPVRERNVAFVMEHLGLYPHLSVFENIAYPLRVRRLSFSEIKRRVRSICEMTGIAELEQRLPSELSGGQRQRVAVARSLIRDDAQVLLADECFSDLDARLRYQLRSEFRSWQRMRNLTCVFVTHDQEEALAVGDRVAIMNVGRIEQIGSPDEVYGRPATLFTAGFLGRPPLNLVPFRGPGGSLTGFGRSFVESVRPIGSMIAAMSNAVLGFRPEDVSVQSDLHSMNGVIESLEPLKPDTLVHLRIEDTPVVARVRNASSLNGGAPILVTVDRSKWHVFDRTTGRRLN